MSPVVLASSRCTMPCRSAAPLVAIVWPAASRPCSTVGPVQPGVGCAATPGGLSTTMMSSSSYTMTRPGTGSGAAGAGAARRQRHVQPLAGRHPVRLGRRPAADQHRARRRSARPPWPGTARTSGPAPRPGARRPARRERAPGAGPPGSCRCRRPLRPPVPRRGLLGPGAGAAARRADPRRTLPAAWSRRSCVPRAASRTASTPPHTIAESARLNTGQCGTWIQSTT